MLKMHFLIFVLLFHLTASASTHVFWREARIRNYSLTDCRPGPCLPRDVRLHEGHTITGSWDLVNGVSLGRLELGCVGDNEMRFASYVWFYDMNRIKKGVIKSAKLRAEFLDSWAGGRALCVAGTLSVRVGVVDFLRTIDALGGVANIPNDGIWVDRQNPIRDSMGFDATSQSFRAEETKTVVVPSGKKTRGSPEKLEGSFFEIDITKQVNWIIANHGGQYGIMLVTTESKTCAGKMTAYSHEEIGPLSLKSDRSWTSDGNTCHILVEEEPGRPLEFSATAAERTAPTAPGIAWVSPKHSSVIREDSIQLALAVPDRRERDNIRSVNFYATYVDTGAVSINKGAGVVVQDTLVAQLDTWPFHTWWHCGTIADQGLGRLRFSCEVLRKDGNDTSLGYLRVALDRNREFSQSTLHSKRSIKPVSLDGNLDEWERGGGISFARRDNIIKVHSRWDMGFLYFGCMILDTSVISHFPQGSSTWNGMTKTGLYDEDEIELFLDLHHDRSQTMGRQHRQFLVSAAGMAYAVVRESGTQKDDLEADIKTCVRTLGTLNDSSRNDTGYVVECAIPWQSIGIVPTAGVAMGLEVWNTDIDSVADTIYYCSWNNTNIGNLRNPSEWGTLVLEEAEGMPLAALLVGGLLLLILAGVVLAAVRKSRGARVPAGVDSPELQERIQKAESLLAKAEDIARGVSDKGEYVKKLEQSNRELEEFSRVASHDLQEPLRKIQAFGDRLTKKIDNELDGQGKDYLSRMQSASTRMRSLIDGLLGLSRVTSKGGEFSRVDLNRVVLEVLADLETKITEMKASVEYGQLPQIDADPMQMRQLFQNLIGNALKFTEKDVNPVVRITSRQSHRPGFCQIMVEDNGIGFEAKYAERVFEAFARLHAKEEYKGTGLGLSICRKIVERHHGRISVESQPGQGTTFTIILPQKLAAGKSASVDTPPDSTPEKAEVRKARKFIERHYQDQALGREKVAHHVGLSPEYFSSSFKEGTGEGFLEFLNNFRVSKAQSLLLGTKMQISEIALETGFKNLDSFEKVFKRVKKISPSSFRIEHNS